MQPNAGAPTRVVDVMVTRPTVHAPPTTAGALRGFFLDDHVHIALIVDERRLLAAIERADLTPELPDRTPARLLATLAERTIRPDAFASEAFETMKRTGRRRLAVTTDDDVLLGLLCLKASGRGFCSDGDVSNRAVRTRARVP